MTQIIFIHGGETFATYEDYFKYLEDSDFDPNKEIFKRWKYSLAKELDNFEVIIPIMPSKSNAKYLEWKLWFEKVLFYVNSEVILIGHSLGGVFLAKYLAENNPDIEIKALYLISAPFSYNKPNYFLNDFILPDSLENCGKLCGKVVLIHSKDDSVVPFKDLLEYQKQLLTAETIVFEDRGHFLQEKFPELIENIKNLA